MTTRVVIDQPCPTCGGTGIDKTRLPDIDRVKRDTGTRHEFRSYRCPACTDGTIRKPVSCAGCKWYQKMDDWCDLINVEVWPDWGCLSWEAREGA